MNVVITTPNGHLGRAVAEILLQEKVNTTVISRDAGRVDRLVSRGAEFVHGALDEPSPLELALRDGGTLFWVTPPPQRPDYREWALAAANLAGSIAKQHGAVRIVNISCMGAHHGRGTGPISPLLEIESIFMNACRNTVSIRPGFFMENLLQHLQTLQKTRTVELPVHAELPLPLVATRDVAAAAAAYILDPELSGHHVVGVHGPQSLSFADLAAILTKELGRTVLYDELSPDEYRQAQHRAGTPAFLIDMYLEMYQALNDRRLQPLERRTRETTTRTTFSYFVKAVLKPALGRAAAAG